jgi:hypothetical protein
MEFINLHTLVIGAKIFKEISDRVKNNKNLCPDSWTIATTPGHKRTYTNPCDSGQWNRCLHNQPTFGDGKVIWQAIPASFFNVNFMGIQNS